MIEDQQLKTCIRMNSTSNLLIVFHSAVFFLFMTGCIHKNVERGNNLMFYVSPDGNDTNNGSIEKPWLSLDGAKKNIGAIDKSGIDTVFVFFRTGEYIHNNTVVFNIKDGSEHSIVIYRNYHKEKPVFSSAVHPVWIVTNIIDVGNNDSIIMQTPIVRANVKASHIDILLCNGRWMPKARSPLFMPHSVEEKEWMTRYTKIPNSFKISKSQEGNSYLSILPKQKWIHNILPIQEINFNANLLKVAVPATYELDSVGFGSFPDGHAWIDNDPFSLDEPGEWYFDRNSQVLYWWPEKMEDTANAIIPAFTELIRVEGRINYNKVDTCVKNIYFKGITFTCGSMHHWEENHTGWGLQHDWEMFDKPTALVRFRGTEHCGLIGCSFINSAGAGIRMDLSAHNNIVESCTFSHLGGTAILLAGYGPGKKDNNHDNRIIDNRIDHIGKILWHSPGIFIWQSGNNIVAGNYIHHTPYSGIIISGRITWDRKGMEQCSKTIRWNEIQEPLSEKPDWYVIEKYLHARNNIVMENEIHNIMLMIGDGNAIYLSGAGRNNKILRNYIHDNYSLQINANIRSDDEQHETIIRGNIIANTMAEGILIKGRCIIDYNIIYNLMPADKNGRYSNYNRGYLAMPTGVVDNSVFKHNIVVSSIPDQTIIYAGKGTLLGRVIYENIDIDSNLYYNYKQDGWTKDYFAFARAKGNEFNSLESKIVFNDTERHNFSFDYKKAIPVGFFADSSAIQFAIQYGHDAFDDENSWWPVIEKKADNRQVKYQTIDNLYITE